jgi:SWI/SNF-related matrix-associated actin-dependent regulator 1 of chromatin subfamily A
MSNSNNGLSAEQIKMIEEKRLKAIQLRNQRSLAFHNNNPNNGPIVGSNPTNNYVKSGNTDSMTNIKPVTPTSRESKYFHKKSPYSRPNTSGQSNTGKKELIASIRLKSNKRFELLIPFNAEVVTICRKIQSKEWDPDSKNWSFDIKDYKELMNELKCIPSVEVKFGDAVPEPVLVTLTKARNKDKPNIDLKERLSSELVDELFPFQREGVFYGIEREGRCLLGDDMGLGKTIQAICLAQWFKSDWPLIIVCPSSLRYQWLNSLNRWLPQVSNKDILVITDTKEYLSRSPITIISYDLLARRKNLFDNESKRFYNMVILDESHYIKTESAARTEAVLLLAKSAKRVVLLTGTPALSRPMGINYLNNSLYLN